MTSSNKRNVIAVLPGGFKPPHNGHFLAAKSLSKIPEVDKVIVFISPKSRFDKNKQLEIDAAKSLQIWKLYVQNYPEIIPQIAESPSPVKEVYDFMEKLNKGDILLLGLGEKDIEDQRFAKAQEYADKNEFGVTVKKTIAKIPAKYDKISASLLRELIVNNDKSKIFRLLPRELSSKEKEKVWNIMSKSNKNENQDLSQGKVEEISAMGGGAVQGFGAPFTRKRKRKFNENEIQYIDRSAFLEELQAREHIRESIHSLHAKDQAEVKKEERLVRGLIKQIIQEEQRDPDDTPHRSTGINILEELLKKIVPILEDAYKSLTTNDTQRKSFRAHILNAVQKTLAQADITGDAGEELSDTDDRDVDTIAEQIESLFAEQDEDEDLTITVGDEEDDLNIGDPDDEPENDDKFIDIKNKKPSQHQDTFGIPGEDETGRNVAEMTYDKIEKNVLDSYTVLGDDDDKILFYDYLLTNLKLYFDKFESELSPAGIEPEAGAQDAEDDSELPDEDIV